MTDNNSTAMGWHSRPMLASSPLATAYHFPAALSIKGRQSCLRDQVPGKPVDKGTPLFPNAKGVPAPTHARGKVSPAHRGYSGEDLTSCCRWTCDFLWLIGC